MKKQKCKWKIGEDYQNIYAIYEIREIFNMSDNSVKWYMIKKRIKSLFSELI